MYSDLRKKYLIDLAGARSAVPAEFRIYSPHGDHIGVNGGKYFDKRAMGKAAHLKRVTSPVQDSLTRPHRLINKNGVSAQCHRAISTHKGVSHLTVTSYHGMNDKEKDRLCAECQNEFDKIEKLYYAEKMEPEIAERAMEGIGLCIGAIDKFSGRQTDPSGEEWREPQQLFMARDSMGKIRGVCLSMEVKDRLYIDRLGSATLSGGGAGTALVHEALSWAKSNNKSAVYLNPMEDAIPFYEKLGFRWNEKHTFMELPVKDYHGAGALPYSSLS